VIAVVSMVELFFN